MTKEAEKNYWFKAKRYGWGWGLPQTWQGWAVFAAFIAIWLTALTWAALAEANGESAAQGTVLLVLIIAADVAGLLYFSFKYGEPPQWRWGKKKS